MAPADSISDMLKTLLAYAGLLTALFSLFGAPFWLYRRYRQRYGEGEGFTVTRVERDEQGPFRSGEQRFEMDVRVTSSAEWAAKLGFFLGILGFLWTPLVLIGIAEGLRPMVTVGLPGLVVSWSVFFAARGFLKRGVGALPLMRFAALSEIALNVWVLALVVLSTISDAGALGESRELVHRLLLVPGARSSGMEAYEIVYSMQKLGLASVCYAAVSLAHARLLLRAWAPLSQAVRGKLSAAA